jgi:hypothetical protein
VHKYALEILQWTQEGMCIELHHALTTANDRAAADSEVWSSRLKHKVDSSSGALPC